jgi:transcriptional regulator with XRE-family HTH domain
MLRSTRRKQAPLEAAIRRNSVNQRQMAAAVGVSPETLSRWVRGHMRPTGDNLVRVLSYLRRFEPRLQAEDLLGAPTTTRLSA